MALLKKIVISRKYNQWYSNSFTHVNKRRMNKTILVASLQSCNRAQEGCDVQSGSDSGMIFLCKFRPYTWLRIMSVSLFSLGKLMAAKYHALCTKFPHERDLWKSRSRERQWSTLTLRLPNLFFNFSTPCI